MSRHLPVATAGLPPNMQTPRFLTKEEAVLDTCPTCGKTIGTLMESHPDRPGMMEILRGGSSEAHRILVTIAVCLLFTLALVATEALFR